MDRKSARATEHEVTVKLHVTFTVITVSVITFPHLPPTVFRVFMKRGFTGQSEDFEELQARFTVRNAAVGGVVAVALAVALPQVPLRRVPQPQFETRISMMICRPLPASHQWHPFQVIMTLTINGKYPKFSPSVHLSEVRMKY